MVGWVSLPARYVVTNGGEEGRATDYGILGREPEVSYGTSSKENGLYVIQYWPRE